MITKLAAGILTFAAVVVVQVFLTVPVHAINPAAFDPGRIIDDAIFYDPGGMGSIGEVQAFLNAHVPSCDTNGTRPSGVGNLTDAQYAQQQGWPGPPYVCLNNYYENPSTGQTSFEMGGGAFPGGVSAAEIIYDAAQQYKINPKVLLVMIRKESLNLFSDSWPLKSQYRYAMGYACPDSGPNYSAACVSSKAGFYNQVNYAAWQLRYYYDNMGSYNYAPGRWNTIQYSTDPSCGTKNVYIQNYATASLYIYTPYTPNDAALNAYPGTAPCGSYGNRNFWFFWQEWFGSTLTNGNFVRTVDNPTVYLIGDKTKYPIADPSLISAASILGGVGFVSQAYLDTMPTGSLLGRTIQSPNGTIYFYDSSIKLPFTSCTMVTAYGGACGSAAVLSQAEIDKFVTGPPMTNITATTSGKRFYVASGVKQEVYDDQSLTQAGISAGINVLNESSLSGLSYGTPIIRSDVFVKDRAAGSLYIYANGSKSQVNPAAQANYPVPSGVNQLDTQSIAQLSSGATIGGFVKSSAGVDYVVFPQGKMPVSTPSDWSASYVTLSDAILAQIPTLSTAGGPYTVTFNAGGTVYYLTGGTLRPITSWKGLLALNPSPNIITLPGYYYGQFTQGAPLLTPGSLVVSPGNSTVYLVDGLNTIVPMNSFNAVAELGFGPIVVVSPSMMSGYTQSTNLVNAAVQCNGAQGLAIGGSVYPVALTNATYMSLSSTDCSLLAIKSTAPSFLLAPSGTIFQIQNGQKMPIASYAKYLSLGGNGANTIPASNFVISYFTQGALLN